MESLYYKPRKVEKVDIGSMSIRQANKYIDDLIVKGNFYDSGEKEPKKLSELSKTAQILLKYKLKVDNNPDMGHQSKAFFRLWRFVFRELQREHGFEKDIEQYDKFVKNHTPVQIKGDYIWVRVTEPEPERTSWDLIKDSIEESRNVRKKVSDTFLSRCSDLIAHEADSTSKGKLAPPPPSPTGRSGRTSTKTETEREIASLSHQSRLNIRNDYHNIQRAVNTWVEQIRGPEDYDLLHSYMGHSIHDGAIIGGMTKALMIWSDQLSKSQFHRAWQVLGIINASDVKVTDVWKSRWGYIESPISFDQLLRIQPSTSPMGLDYTNIASRSDVYKFRGYNRHLHSRSEDMMYSAQLIQHMFSNLHDTKFRFLDKPRNQFDLIEEFLFRSIYYYHRKNADLHTITLLPIDPARERNKDDFASGEMLSDKEREEIQHYKNKLQAIINVPQCPF